MTGVLIVDDHPVILQGFRRVVEDAGVAMIVEAGDPVSGYRLFHRIRPQVAVVDLTFRGSGLAGLALIKRMRALEPRARILAFSMHRDPIIAARALEAGAIGYVFKDSPVPDFLAAFDAVREGRPYLPHLLATQIAGIGAMPEPSRYDALNAREIQVSILLREGRSYRFIADNLSIGYRTVVNTCASIRKKLGARTQAELLKMIIAVEDLESQG
ncbi:response regulator transcription factor [Methylobacterium gregans]|uniref:Transcriptional activator protein ExaE n=1 Tax=Methylobacterium gregans TaxID=374424 RepID=A0AA37MCP5_9HYPH|nr:response regulator transcription factor [Methylobacterium gregans]MDQ0519608.1 DNA-binding NarL/FixJ family response regulator [Methylobacterium gregans]GJD79694.1 Transcriptional activator protein ExaE [Methylobacterium gregans]GLS52748.1 DNA-binding response regulator [Methylobacterium gregans]